jgi:hypothetical protein
MIQIPIIAAAAIILGATPPGGPLVRTMWGQALVIVAAYVLTLALSGVIVRFFVRAPAAKEDDSEAGPSSRPRFDAGAVIGKCENIITVTCVLLGEVTGLALIFAAKSIVRTEDIRRNASYYLGGTLVNLVWGLVVAVLARVLVVGTS